MLATMMMMLISYGYMLISDDGAYDDDYVYEVTHICSFTLMMIYYDNDDDGYDDDNDYDFLSIR